MSNARMIIDNLVDTAAVTLTQGAELASLPVSNLQKFNNSRVFRTTSTSITIEVELLSSAWLSGLALWKTNFTSSATYQVLIYNLADELVHDSGQQLVSGVKALSEIDFGISPLGESFFTDWRLSFSVYWFSLLVGKRIVLHINDPGRTTPMQIARLYLGRALEPRYNFCHGEEFSWEDDSEQHPTAGGSAYSPDAEEWREITIELDAITATDRPHFADAFRKVTTKKDWFISLWPEAGGILERDYTMACKCLEVPKIKSKNSRFYGVKKLPLREV